MSCGQDPWGCSAVRTWTSLSAGGWRVSCGGPLGEGSDHAGGGGTSGWIHPGPCAGGVGRESHMGSAQIWTQLSWMLSVPSTGRARPEELARAVGTERSASHPTLCIY